MRTAVGATLMVVALAGHAAAAPPLLAAKLAALSGSGARDCGDVALGADRRAAIDCAHAAAAASQAYRVAFALSGVDTYTWQGAARGADGKQWVVFYDADTASGADATPGLGQLWCRDITFDAKKPEAIDCVPVTGGN